MGEKMGIWARGALALGLCLATAPAHAAPGRDAIVKTMKRATTFMVEKVATSGGYVWSYLPDKSRRWGELEAAATMVWVQPPGTATMGHIFLDAYHATGDDYYYRAAEQVAGALIWGQRPEGGWHYFIDFGGEASTKHWYDTIGRNAWRLEEFQYYWGNSTFDDAGTSEAMQFLLRLYVERRDPKYRPVLERAIDFVLKAQYPNGGWPQRYPLRYDHAFHGKPDYTSFITFNDDVAGENIRFLIQCYQALGEARVLEPINRALSVFLVTQQGAPQPGWGLQYLPDTLKPVGARSIEPDALVTHTTASNIRQLLNFYRMTGESKYLARVGDALDWLETVRLPESAGRNKFPTFIEIGTNKPLYVHRRGSNIVNGEYYVDYDPARTIVHYSSTRTIDVAALRKELAALEAMPVAEATKGSPLLSTEPVALPRFYITAEDAGSDLNAETQAGGLDGVVRGLNGEGWWPTLLKATSNPYRGDGSATPAPGDFSQTRVGDATDTSPYIADKPVIGISTGTYITNMAALIGELKGTPRR